METLDWLFNFIYFLCGVNAVLFIINVLISRKQQAKSIGDQKFHLLCVIGSGGHTTEILKLLKGLESRYSKRTYVIAATDRMGKKKVIDFEESGNNFHPLNLQDNINNASEYCIKFIPRSREVKQSYLTSIWTTLYASFYSFCILNASRPDIVLSNGPGTGLPICIIAALFSLFHINETKVIFVESICRVKTLSLTGLILYRTRLAHVVLVQWPELHQAYPRTNYIGRLI